jgi:hypothetical protein
MDMNVFLYHSAGNLLLALSFKSSNFHLIRIQGNRALNHLDLSMNDFFDR